MEPLVSLNISGQVPSGKNAQGLAFRGGRVQKYPRDSFVAWRSSFMLQARCQTTIRDHAEPLRFAIMYRQRDRIRRDVPGQLDALWHGLHRSGILADDYYPRRGTIDEVLDRENPGVEIHLYRSEGI